MKEAEEDEECQDYCPHLGVRWLIRTHLPEHRFDLAVLEPVLRGTRSGGFPDWTVMASFVLEGVGRSCLRGFLPPPGGPEGPPPLEGGV